MRCCRTPDHLTFAGNISPVEAGYSDMDNLTVFQFDAQEIEVVIIDDQPWFNSAQVAKALGYLNNSKAIQDNVSAKYNQQLDLGRPGKKPIFVSEPGLYQLIMKSTLPAAERFQDWVFEKVLPEIRKTGSYSLKKPEEKAPAPALPPIDVRLANLANAMDIFQKSLGSFNPYIQQEFKDLLGNMLTSENQRFAQKVLPGEHTDFRGIVALAEDLGFKVSIKGDKCRTNLGKFIKIAAPHLANKKEKRLCNETQRPIYVYPLHIPEVREELTRLIYQFFEKEIIMQPLQMQQLEHWN